MRLGRSLDHRLYLLTQTVTDNELGGFKIYCYPDFQTNVKVTMA